MLALSRLPQRVPSLELLILNQLCLQQLLFFALLSLLRLLSRVAGQELELLGVLDILGGCHPLFGVLLHT